MDKYALIKRFSQEIASDVAYVEELAACLYQDLSTSALISDLRYLAEVATDLANTLEAEDD